MNSDEIGLNIRRAIEVSKKTWAQIDILNDQLPSLFRHEGITINQNNDEGEITEEGNLYTDYYMVFTHDNTKRKSYSLILQYYLYNEGSWFNSDELPFLLLTYIQGSDYSDDVMEYNPFVNKNLYTKNNGRIFIREDRNIVVSWVVDFWRFKNSDDIYSNIINVCKGIQNNLDNIDSLFNIKASFIRNI
jgi:hypothetical protein